MNTPILLLLFNRPKNTREIMRRLALVQPRKLYIVADGPRDNVSTDKLACQSVREIVADTLTWKCTVKKLYRSKNMGCKDGVSTAISWFFQQVDYGIILEDDCLPDPSFFPFCTELLIKYKYNKKILTISGDYFHKPNQFTHASYYFSRYPHVWGWASWRRVWKLYDPDLKDWPERKKMHWLSKISKDYFINKYWEHIFDKMYLRKIDTWDYQLTYTSLVHNGYNIIPSVNLISNTGYGETATHTKKKNNMMNMPTKKINFPMKHPSTIRINTKSDKLMDNKYFLSPKIKTFILIKSCWARLLESIKSI